MAGQGLAVGLRAAMGLPWIQMVFPGDGLQQKRQVDRCVRDQAGMVMG